jgi:hypothetical protein
MACAGALTSIVMTAAGAFIANGGLSEIFGSAPISSAAGATAEVAVSAGGSTMTTAAQTVGAITETAGQSWYSSLGETLSSMKDSFIEFSSNMKSVWNNIATAPVAAGNEVFLQTVGTWGPKTAQFLQSVTTGAFQTALNMGLTSVGTALGGNGNLVAGVMQGDPRVLGSIIPGAQSYVSLANSFINASQKGGTLDKTFQSLDKTITAGVDGVSNWFKGLGDDIAELGDTISWENISNLGSPGQLVANMENNGTLGPLYDKMKDIKISEKDAQQLGYNVVTSVYGLATGGKNSIGVLDITRGIPLGSLGVDLNTVARQGANLPSGVQKQIYDVLGTLNTTEVAQVKSILNNKQAAVTNGTDLLNPQKLFAKSYTTLTTPIRTASPGWRAIYENESGSLNPELDNLGGDLKGIIPDDLAVANAAVARSFGQIKGIQSSSSSTLGAVIADLENLRGLPDLENQSQYVTEGVKQFWQDYYGNDYDIKLSTGNLDTMVLSDVIGFAAGYNSGKPIGDNAPLLSSLAASGAFDEFTQSQGIYETIQTFCTGVWTAEDPMMPGDWYTTIPPGWAAAGIYGPFATAEESFEDAWVNGIVPFTALANVDITNNYNDARTVLANETVWQEQYGREYLNKQRMDLVIADIRPSDQTAISFAQALPNYGVDTYFGGPAMWLERVVNIDSLGGQAVVGAMREGRNTKKLNAIGLQTDAPLNTSGLEYPGELTPNQYTKQEAEELVIRT